FVEARAVALLLEACHGLAHLADRPSLQREGTDLDDGLVAEVERVQAELTPEGQGPLAEAERRDVQAARLGEAAQLPEQPRDRLVRSDRITGDEEDARLDAVAEERLPVGAEEVVLVAAELEVGERVGAVPADELPGRVPRFAGRERARRRERAEHEVRAPEQQQQAGHAHGLVDAAELVAEGDRAALPEQRVVRLANDRPERRAPGRGEPDGEAAE